MILFFSLAFSCLFAYITYRRFEYGLFLFFLLLPTYLIRFSLLGIPTTLLEMMFLILFGIWLLSRISQKNMMGFGLRVMGTLKQFYQTHTILTYSTTLFLLGATISIFTSVDIRTALGEWKAFYVEPVLLFILLVHWHTTQSTPEKSAIRFIYTPLILCGLITALFAVIQRYTDGWMVPYAFWENRATYRVTAWYGFPNAVGLFLAPLIPLALYIAYTTYAKEKYIAIVSILCIILSTAAILFAKSTGAIIGVIGSIGITLVLYKRTRIITLLLGTIATLCILTLPQLAPIKEELLFQDRSGQIRLAIYDETKQLLADRPLLGAGIASYEERIEPYHGLVNGESIEIYHHPHNLFLTLWINIGLIGLVGFVGILFVLFRHGVSFYAQTRTSFLTSLSYSALLSLCIILITGLVDSPYIKNDLAFLFWAIIALIHITTQSNRQDTLSHIQ
jgi:O-antigen ligase